MRLRARRPPLGAALLAALALALPAAAAAAPAPPPPTNASTADPARADPAAQALADRFAPYTMVREEDPPPCDVHGEQYEPTTVDITLGNPLVTLDRNVPGRFRPRPVRRGPTAHDIAGLGRDYYLNLPGSPLGQTCVYARAFRAIKAAGRAPALTYAHVSREAGYPGFALQFFFYWYFNQFNDLHESDWEGMQLWFDQPTPAAALAANAQPSRMILFQHAGGEQASWDDAKVEKDGDHPVVYPAAGSHATFYSPAVYVENGEHGSGLGCDDSSPPLREIHPRPVLMPRVATTAGPWAWTSYLGHWGQKEAGFNDGPTGPATKHQWLSPFTWMEAQRHSSNRMPGGSVVGPQVTNAFCGTVAAISGLLNAKEKDSTGTLLGLSVAALLLLAFVGVTRWGPVDLRELRARRSFGQLLRTARQLYGRHWLAMVAIAATAVPIVGGVQWLVGVLDPGSAGGLAVGDLLTTLSRPVADAIVAGVVIVYVRLLVEHGEAGFGAAWRGMARRFGRVVVAQLLATLALIGMAVTVVGIPFAIWKLVGWAFVQQEVLFSDRPVRGAFRASSDVVRGRWWHAVRPMIFLSLLTAVAGPALTFALIFTSLPLWLINLLGSLIFALLIPYVALGETLLYFDLEARAAAEGVRPRRSLRVWRPRSFGRRVPGSGTAPAPAPAPAGAE